MPLDRLAYDPADIEAALRLAAGAPAADPRRRHALALVEGVGGEPPWEWWASVYASVAWHLVAEALSVVPEGTVVEAFENSGGQVPGIVVWNREEGRWPAILMAWTTGHLWSEDDPRPLKSNYGRAFLSGRGALERSVRARFAGAEPGVSASRITAARLLSRLTDEPMPLRLEPPRASGEKASWGLRVPGTDRRVTVDMAAGEIQLPTGVVVDARQAMKEINDQIAHDSLVDGPMPRHEERGLA